MTTTQQAQSWHVSEFVGRGKEAIYDNTGREVAYIPHDSFTAEEEACHARLIAAAPDLLTALADLQDKAAQLLDTFDHNLILAGSGSTKTPRLLLSDAKDVRVSIDQARAALALAKGH